MLSELQKDPPDDKVSVMQSDAQVFSRIQSLLAAAEWTGDESVSDMAEIFLYNGGSVEKFLIQILSGS